MFSYKIVSIFFLIFLSCDFQVLIGQNQDPNNKSLIDFVKDRQNYFDTINKNILEIWAEYVETSQYSTFTNVMTDWTVYSLDASKEGQQALWQLHDHQQEIKTFEEDTVAMILEKMRNGYDIHAIDQDGKTVLDYAWARPIYNALRDQGADFQIKPFLYINRYYIGSFSGVLFIIAFLLFQSGYWSYEMFCDICAQIKSGIITSVEDLRNFGKEQELPAQDYLHERDELGRTKLMDYLIERQDFLLEMQEKVQIIKRKYINYEFHPDVLLYQATLESVRIHIARLIGLGADVDVVDNAGYSLLDYCYIQEIYDDLRAAGAPFQLDRWLYFNGNKVVGAAVLAIPVVVVAYHLENKFHAGLHFFDKNFENKVISIIGRRPQQR